MRRDLERETSSEGLPEELPEGPPSPGDPALTLARVVMVLTPLVLSGAVYLVLKLSTGP